VSRIDEALRRAAVNQDTAAPPPPRSQAHFVSAWPDAGPSAAVESRSVHVTEAPVESSRILTTPPSSVLPMLNTAWGERVASARECSPELIEAFRRLGATLHQAKATSGIRIIMVTSAVPSDGKTLTSINLALVLSGSYNMRVLLIDADLRRPSIGDIAGLKGGSGLSDALKAQTDQKLALVPLTPMLSLLPSGPPDPDPIGGLTSPRMKKILDEATTLFDWVIVDAPPVVPLADANLLAEMVDGTLFVVRAGTTQYPVVQEALDTLGRDRVLGIVLNGVEPRGNEYAGYYGVAADL